MVLPLRSSQTKRLNPARLHSLRLEIRLILSLQTDGWTSVSSTLSLSLSLADDEGKVGYLLIHEPQGHAHMGSCNQLNSDWIFPAICAILVPSFHMFG